MIVLYRYMVFSTMLRVLYPEDVCHSRRPNSRIEQMLRFLSLNAAEGFELS